jgi:hypothetical protein
MKSAILTAAASAVIALSSVHFAAAAEHHSGKLHYQGYTEFRNGHGYAAPDFSAYAPPAYGAPDWERYGDYAAQDGH